MSVELIQPGEQVLLMDANAGAAPQNGNTFALPTTYAKTLAWTTSFASAPGSASVKIQIANDPNGPWSDFDTSTVVAGETKNPGSIAAGFIRAQKSAQSGGGALTVRAVLSYG